jgi:hypothetical protein
MKDPTAVEDAKLQLARQIYERCREQYGEDSEQTRLMRRYLVSFEKPGVDFTARASGPHRDLSFAVTPRTAA